MVCAVVNCSVVVSVRLTTGSSPSIGVCSRSVAARVMTGSCSVMLNWNGLMAMKSSVPSSSTGLALVSVSVSVTVLCVAVSPAATYTGTDAPSAGDGTLKVLPAAR